MCLGREYKGIEWVSVSPCLHLCSAGRRRWHSMGQSWRLSPPWIQYSTPWILGGCYQVSAEAPLGLYPGIKAASSIVTYCPFPTRLAQWLTVLGIPGLSPKLRFRTSLTGHASPRRPGAAEASCVSETQFNLALTSPTSPTPQATDPRSALAHTSLSLLPGELTSNPWPEVHKLTGDQNGIYYREVSIIPQL